MNRFCKKIEKSDPKFKPYLYIQEKFQTSSIKFASVVRSRISVDVEGKFCQLIYLKEDANTVDVFIAPSSFQEQIILLFKTRNSNSWRYNSTWRIENLLANFVDSGK